MISVVMANYNGEAYLRQALQSVVDQDFDAYECIVVDDGSTDGSPTLIGGFAQGHPELIKPIFKTDNEGQGVAFNTGLEASAGDLICFLDSDDYWFPNKLREVAAWQASSEPAALYQHNLYLDRGDAAMAERYDDTLRSGDLFRDTRRTRKFPTFVPTSGLAFPRAVLDKVLPIPSAFRTCADGYLTRTAFCHGRVASMDACWGCYRVHDANRVFGNPRHSMLAYKYRLLIPALNRYYEQQRIDFRFSTNWLIGELRGASVQDVVNHIRRKLRKRR